MAPTRPLNLKPRHSSQAFLCLLHAQHALPMINDAARERKIYRCSSRSRRGNDDDDLPAAREGVRAAAASVERSIPINCPATSNEVKQQSAAKSRRRRRPHSTNARYSRGGCVVAGRRPKSILSLARARGLPQQYIIATSQSRTTKRPMTHLFNRPGLPRRPSPSPLVLLQRDASRLNIGSARRGAGRRYLLPPSVVMAYIRPHKDE